MTEKQFFKEKLFILVAAILFATGCSQPDPTVYVDPNIGGVAPLLTTKNPTVHRPNSMVRVFPVTEPGLSDRFLSDKIYGFAFNMPAYRMGHVTELMPFHGELQTDRNKTAAFYDHDLEEVHPWHHKVLLEEPDIVAEWTTTERSVLYRFTFPAENSSHIIVRTRGNSHIEINGNTLSGWEEFQNTRQYFFVESSEPFTESGFMQGNELKTESSQSTGQNLAAAITFYNLETPVEWRIGISYISAEQAQKNLAAETGSKSFEEIKQQSFQIWKDALGKIRVTGGTEREKRIFYTCLYRSYERMVNISEDSKYFSGYDRKVRESDSRPFYVDDWLWDTFRSLHPLGLILHPEKEADMVQSYVRMYEQDGWMPGFPQFYGDFPAMIGFHSAALVWDTYQKGIQNFDVQKAYEGLKKNAMEGTMLPWRTGPMCSLDSFYHENGWYPALEEGEEETVPQVHSFEKRQAVALTLEHSYDDWCLAQLAKALGKDADYTYFMKRSQNYRNVYNPETGFMSPKKANGEWVPNFDPQLSGGIGSRMYFAENNSWIWTFNVMHDIDELIGLMGGDEQFVYRLDRLFNQPTKNAKWQFMGQFPDASGLHGMFPAGNEPAFHVPYLYNYAGQPWKTQYRIRQVLDMWFDDSPLGLSGDEDGGAMCAWYVLSAMGFYPVTPGTGIYAIGSPVFEKVEIDLPNGKTFSVEAKNNSKRNKYIQSASLNGQSINRPWLTHEELMSGGVLNLEMGERANKNWGTETSWYRNELKNKGIQK
jgi:predicted alpha-1,2-mannosidase